MFQKQTREWLFRPQQKRAMDKYFYEWLENSLKRILFQSDCKSGIEKILPPFIQDEFLLIKG